MSTNKSTTVLSCDVEQTVESAESSDIPSEDESESNCWIEVTSTDTGAENEEDEEANQETGVVRRDESAVPKCWKEESSNELKQED